MKLSVPLGYLLGMFLAVACSGNVSGQPDSGSNNDGQNSADGSEGDQGADAIADGGSEPSDGDQGNPTGAVITVVKLSEQTGKNWQDIPVSFAQVFAPGAVDASKHLAARLDDATLLSLQTDVKARHPDGSLRHAIFSLRLPSLSAGAIRSVELLLSDQALAGAALSTNALLNDGFDATVSIKLDGVSYQASARDALALAQADTWLSGPIASEWLLRVPFQAGAISHPHLTAGFAIRSYADPAQTRVDVVVENGWAFAAEPQNFSYDVAISIDGVEVYAQTNITHYRQARWRKTLWRASVPAIHVAVNTKDWGATGALPGYNLSLAIDESALQSNLDSLNADNTGPLAIALLTAYMPGTGAHPDIGPLTRWAAMDFISQDPRARTVTLAIGNAAASWSIHYRDKNTDLPVLISDYPYMTILGNPGDTVNPATGQSEAFPACGGDCATPYRHDTAHQPSLTYLPYLYTGDHFYLEELQFWSSYNLLQSNPHYRNFSEGLLKNQQTRGQAWTLRTLGYTAYITPDDHPLKSFFLDRLHDNLAWYNVNYPQNPQANALGILTQSYVDFPAMAGWMDDFFTWTVGQLVAMGFSEARPIFEYKARFPIGRMLGDFCWILATPYHLVTGSSTDAADIFPNFADMYHANANQDCSGSPLYDLTCNSQAMADCLGRKRGDMGGYSQSATGYPSNFQPALAISAELDAVDADTAWTTFISRDIQPDYNSSPQFAIVPRN